MVRQYHILVLFCLGLFAVTLLVPEGTGAQDQKRLHPWPISVKARIRPPALMHPTAMLAQDTPFSLYMPIIRKPIEVTAVQFASAVSSEGTLVNPQAAFDYGVTTVFIAATVRGGRGSRYLVRWSFNGTPAPSLDRTGMIEDQTQLLTAGFCNSTGNGCSAPAPIPRITMRVQVFLDGTLFSEGTAEIR